MLNASRLIFKLLRCENDNGRYFCSTLTKFESGHLGVSGALGIRETEINRHLA